MVTAYTVLQPILLNKKPRNHIHLICLYTMYFNTTIVSVIKASQILASIKNSPGDFVQMQISGIHP